MFGADALILTYSDTIGCLQRNKQPRIKPMQAIQNSYRGLSLLVDVNWDRILYPITIVAALFAGAFFGSLILG